MRYKDEDTQTEYHKMDLDVQIAMSELEDKLAEKGLEISIQECDLETKELQIVIRIAN